MEDLDILINHKIKYYYFYAHTSTHCMIRNQSYEEKNNK